MSEPAAWGVLRVEGGWVSILANEVQAETSRQSFDKMENWTHEVVPLYRQPQPTLTDAERQVLECAIEVSDSLADCGATGTGGEESHESATLRGLLERLK